MLQKVMRVGNSLAVTLPSKFVKAVQRVSVEADAGLGLTPEFKGWLDKIVRNEEKLIKDLAER